MSTLPFVSEERKLGEEGFKKRFISEKLLHALLMTEISKNDGLVKSPDLSS